MPEPTVDWVALTPRFTPGWPWPENSYGLRPMYGDDGWCRGCGTPLVVQSGPLVMQGSKFPKAEVWTPNWLFDVVCVSASLADTLVEQFAVNLGEVHKPRTGATGAMQLLPTQTTEFWHRPRELMEAVRARHSRFTGDRTGASCELCGRWKWLPVGEEEVPVISRALKAESALIASPERFGDGMSSFRHLLFRRSLAETLVAASPRNWDLVEVRVN